MPKRTSSTKKPRVVQGRKRRPITDSIWTDEEIQSLPQRRRVQASRPTYFDLMPSDVLGIIVRQMSSKPRLVQWACDVGLDDMSVLVSVGGPLQSVACNMFSALEVGCTEAQKWPPKLENENVRPLRMADNSDAQSTISALTGDLKHVTLSNVKPRTLRALATRSYALESLELRGTEFNECALELLLRACGPRTVALRISGVRSYMTAVRKHWPMLRDLHLFNIENNLFANAAFWRTVGPSLERLALSVRSSGRHNLNNIRKHCTRLRAISIQGRESLHPCIADFVSSYGEQLEHLSLTYMENRFFAKIGIACPKAQFEFEFDDDENLIKVLPYVGNRLVKATVFVFFNMRAAVVPLITASKTCVALKNLRVVGDIKASFVRALVQHAGRELRVLDIFGLLKTGPRIIEAIANGTGQLRRFCYHGYAQPSGVFGSLVEANPHLEDVIIHVSFTGFQQIDSLTIAQNILLDLVQTFSEAATLRSLIIPVVMGVRKERFKLVSDACQVFRFRNVHVELLGLDYLT